LHHGSAVNAWRRGRPEGEQEALEVVHAGVRRPTGGLRRQEGGGPLRRRLIGIPLTGTSVNPARSIGPAVFVGFPALSQRWLFIMAPLVGAVLAFGDLRVLVSEPRFSSADRRVVQ
jgi:hypothetical protein